MASLEKMPVSKKKTIIINKKNSTRLKHYLNFTEHYTHACLHNFQLLVHLLLRGRDRQELNCRGLLLVQQASTPFWIFYFQLVLLSRIISRIDWWSNSRKIRIGWSNFKVRIKLLAFLG